MQSKDIVGKQQYCVQESRQSGYVRSMNNVLPHLKVCTFLSFVCWNWCNSTLLALPIEEQDAVVQMFEDEGMDIQYDVPIPFNSLDSDHDGDNDSDNDNEFSGLSQHNIGRFVHPSVLYHSILLKMTC